VAITFFLDVLDFVAINNHERFTEASMWLRCFDTRLAFQLCPRRTSPLRYGRQSRQITSCLRGKIVANLLVKVEIQCLDWESLGAVPWFDLATTITPDIKEEV
jgi:hypothetical protein